MPPIRFSHVFTKVSKGIKPLKYSNKDKYSQKLPIYLIRVQIKEEKTSGKVSTQKQVLPAGLQRPLKWGQMWGTSCPAWLQCMTLHVLWTVGTVQTSCNDRTCMALQPAECCVHLTWHTEAQSMEIMVTLIKLKQQQKTEQSVGQNDKYNEDL